MYSPNFNYNDKIVSLLIKIENTKSTLATLDFASNVEHKLVKNVRSLDMMHFANELGYEITVKDGYKLSTGVKVGNMTDADFKIIANFRSVLEFNTSRDVSSYSEVDYSILHHLNRLLINGWEDTWETKLRNAENKVDESWDDWEVLRDKDLAPEQVENAMFNVVDWYKSSIPTMTPLVRLLILIFRLIEIYPFIAANKFTIIALADYVLYRNGFSLNSYTSTIRIFNKNKKKVEESYLVSKKANDLSYWIEQMLVLMNSEMNEVRESISGYMVEEEKAKQQPFLDLNKRQLKVLRYLQSVPFVKREDYCHMMDVSTMTAFRDLNDLVRKKLLKIDGKGRGTKYRLTTM
jgi:Fic family protein